MEHVPAIAVLDFSEIPAGVAATDAMLKRAPVAFVRSGSVTRGRFLTVIGGSTAAVEEALQAARWVGEKALLDHVFLADVDRRLLAAMRGERRPAQGAVALIETDTAAAGVRAAELALKGTAVELSEIRLADSGLAGKALVVLSGALHDLEAAVEVVTGRFASLGLGVRHQIVAAPHAATIDQLGLTTRFDLAPAIDLGGEVD